MVILIISSSIVSILLSFSKHLTIATICCASLYSNTQKFHLPPTLLTLYMPVYVADSIHWTHDTWSCTESLRTRLMTVICLGSTVHTVILIFVNVDHDIIFKLVYLHRTFACMSLPNCRYLQGTVKHESRSNRYAAIKVWWVLNHSLSVSIWLCTSSR